MDKVMQKIISLTKRRGFVYPGSEIYGGLANASINNIKVNKGRNRKKL